MTNAVTKPLRLLFLGNYLSAKRGTIGPSETLAKWMEGEGVHIQTASGYESKILRALHLLFTCACMRYDLACADVFTGNIQHILPLLCRIVNFRKKRLVLILHGGQLPDLFQNQPQRVRQVLEKADLLVTPSPHLKQYFLEKGFSIALIPNAIDLQKFRYARPYISEQPKILWIRAFSKIYNPLLAVEILYAVQRRFPGATLTMIGPDAGMLAETRQKIKEKGLESSVHIMGPVPNDRILEYHHSHTVLLNTTSYESFGVAILEGASSGIPLVSSRVGSLPLIWEDQAEILLIPSWEAQDFADAIFRLADDPDLTLTLSTNAQKKAAEYGIDWIAPKWLQLLYGILER